MQNRRSSSMMLFVLGIFSETQVRVVGSIGISELFIFVFAPLLFILDYHDLKRNGFMPVLTLAFMSCVGCIVSSLHNGTPTQLFLRGFAAAYSLFAIPVVLHHYLWRNLNGFKWFLIGCAISSIITIFAFTGAAEMAVTDRFADGASTPELYYMIHFGPLTALPLNAFYMNFPIIGGVISLLIPTVYTLFTTSTARSALMMMLVTTTMVLSVGKSIRRMAFLKKHMINFLIIASVVAVSSASMYKYLALHDYLTPKAREKYEGQTKGGKGLLGLIMGGRSEFFIGLIAVLDKPIFGHGPWALDQKGYTDEFLRDYGDSEDYRRLEEWNKYLMNTYGRRRIRTLPCHSMIIGNWLYFGILGLPFWFYILWQMLNLLRKHIDAVPQWFGYFAVTIPSMVWSIFFSGYGARMSTGLFMTALFLAMAVGKDRIRLPDEFVREIQNHLK